MIIPKPNRTDSPQLYQGIWSVGSYVKSKGFNVKIYDEQYGEATKNLKEIIRDSFAVGFTAMTVQLKSAKELSMKIHSKGIPIIWGGTHPTLFPLQCMKENYIDYVVFDEGEATMAELSGVLINKELKSLKNVKGIYYKIKGKVQKTEARPYLDLNDISKDFDLLEPNRYTIKQPLLGEWKNISSIETGRGCFFRCTFCINTLLNQRRWRGCSAEKIVYEVKRMMARYEVDHIFFLDENFFTDKKRVERFCELYVAEKFKFTWAATARVNYFRPSSIDDKLMKTLHKCNCIEVQMGIESGSQRVLDEIINKDIKKDDIILVVKRMKKFKIQPTCSFMIGLPNETIDEQKETLELIKTIIRLNKNVYILGPQIYRPYPGAKMYTLAQELGFKAPNNINSWIKFLNEAGFLNTATFPWIKNKNELENISKYFTYSQISPRGINYLFSTFFKNIFLWRISHNFYKFGLDLFIFEKLKNLYFSIRVSAAALRQGKKS